MKEYVIVTDTGSDLEQELRAPYGIEYVSMRCIIGEKDSAADPDWGDYSAKEFYDMLRAGKRIRTAQVPPEDYKAIFEKHLSAGKDVLYIATSSNISAGVNTARTVAVDIAAKYPENKIVIVDALRACYALGILVLTAAEFRADGKTIDEVAAWLEENKLTANMEGTVDKLTWLKQAGRVSATSAFFGGLLNIKPIIMADAQGKNYAVEKTKGRKNSLERVAQRVADTYVDVPYQKVFISHADCLEDAETLKALVCEKVGKELNVHIGYVGCCVGASVGPGQLGVYYFGKKVTTNAPPMNA